MPVKAIADVSVGAVARVAAAARANAGEQSRYGIFPGYRHRITPSYFDDTVNTDDWQREVYEFAVQLMDKEQLASVYDVGCGSGYKLVHYLGKYATTGFDVDETVAFLESRYPDRQWRSAPFSERGLPPVDLVICSDVIEHVDDPDQLLAFIDAVPSRYIIISTPERDLLYRMGGRRNFGPPANTTHMREWSFRELASYIGSTFEILDHKVTNPVQGTQMVLCERTHPAPLA